MSELLSSKAAEAYKKGDYKTALDFYRKLAKQIGDKFFIANIKLCEANLRQETGRDSRQIQLSEMRVACIMDDFTFHSFAPECELLQLTPNNAIDELEKFKPDILFIESAWLGKDGLWDRKIATLSNELKTILKWCKEHLVASIFWNKEDPVHFETFLTAAQQFDCVFTTDIDCVPRYKAALGHDRVYFLPFACQPTVHNPIELYERKDAFCFAGAYYVKYPDRTRDLENYIKELPKYKPLEIFDRNYGKEDVNYMFPEEYKPYIVGTLPFHEIDKAYKGYRYSINLNSIKQSQTMFARRVYELMASNTITVSNFSRGVRLMFGDLVISSDDGSQIVNRLTSMDRQTEDRIRLAGLRKVLSEHTYEHRLAYIAEKSLGWVKGLAQPSVVVLALVKSKEDYKKIFNNINNQTYKNIKLIIVCDQYSKVNLETDIGIKHLSFEEASKLSIGSVVGEDEWLSIMVPEDYYGPNYLTDIALAKTYTESDIIGKAEYFESKKGSVKLIDSNLAYRTCDEILVRASVARNEAVPRVKNLGLWLESVASAKWKQPGLSIDTFNYCLNGNDAAMNDQVKNNVNDLHLDQGIQIDELLKTAESSKPAPADDSNQPRWNSAKLLRILGQVSHQAVEISNSSEGLCFDSKLADGKHDYIYAKEILPISEFPTKNFDSYVEAIPGLSLQYVFIFLDFSKSKINHSINIINKNNSIIIPEGTAFVKMGWRIGGSGLTYVKELLWGRRLLDPSNLFPMAQTLILTNNYPSYKDLYRNGFVHSRAQGYLKSGLAVDVFTFKEGEVTSFHEFEDIDAITGGASALHKLLKTGCYKRVLVHFLSEEMWKVLVDYSHIKYVFWIHGAEIQPWFRRDYNNLTEQQREKSIIESDKRIKFWKNILNPIQENIHLVFVSKYLADVVFEDLELKLDSNKFSIIHNGIDTELFRYLEKDISLRKKILSIRPYASRTYANDLTVKVILNLSKSHRFEELEFKLIGDGILFDETLKPLKNFPNVKIQKGFLSQKQISEIHKEFGIFLVPTRMDTQGVSRDEAMSSGLIPITNNVAAIPEFVDNDCGILAEAEDVKAMVDGIEAISNNSNLFKRMSYQASRKVRNLSDKSEIIKKEILLILK